MLDTGCWRLDPGAGCLKFEAFNLFGSCLLVLGYCFYNKHDDKKLFQNSLAKPYQE
jgi:hypothetical protein